MFNYSICEPLNPKIIEKTNISKRDFINLLERFSWHTMLEESEQTDPSKVYYSPSLGLTDTNSNLCLEISIIGPIDDVEFYVFYRRPRYLKKRKWFKTIEVLEPEYISHTIEKDIGVIQEAFYALLNSDIDQLEERWGSKAK